jgi:hypothetical protein
MDFNSLQLPVEMPITFTKQVGKKNKVFSEGYMEISACLVVKVFDEFRVCVASLALRGNTVKMDVFFQQYARAISDGLGLIQGVFDSVLVHVECPPVIEGFCGPCSVPDPKRMRADIVKNFIPATSVSSPQSTDEKLVSFHPVSCVTDLMSLYEPPSKLLDSEPPIPQLERYCLGLLNTLYGEVFSCLSHKNKSFSNGKKWRLEMKADKCFLCLPPSTDPPREFIDIFIVIYESKERLLAPSWKAFDMRGKLEVIPFSREALDMTSRNTNKTVYLEQVRGLVGLHSNPSLVRQVGKFINKPEPLLESIIGGDAKPIETLKDRTGSTIQSDLSVEQSLILEKASNWFENSDSPCLAVHGVFGSGKSKVLAACIDMLAERLSNGQRILLTASTNIAVDNVLARLKNKADVSRLGVAERVDPTLRTLMSKKRSKIIAATVTCAFSEIDYTCDIVIIDEASQVTEICGIPLLMKLGVRRIILVGDVHQLRQPGTENLSPCLLEAFEKCNSPLVDKVELLTQYRCHPEIARMCSNLFYNGKVVSGISGSVDVPSLPPIACVAHACVSSRGSLNSQRNLGEFDLIRKFLSSYDFRNVAVSILSFYTAQVAMMKEEILHLKNYAQELRIDTVDSFQGGEADVVIISTVSSIPQRSEPFIANPTRLNVALSRAKQHVIIFGHSHLWERLNVYTRIAQYGQMLL